MATLRLSTERAQSARKLQRAVKAKVRGLLRFGASPMATSRELGKTRLPLWAAGFVVLICLAILGLSAWREWESRNAELRNAETDVANLAHSLVQHADDTFELADTILVGLVHRLELDGMGPDTIEKLQTYLPTRKSSDRIRGIFVYDETGRWLATTEQIDFSKL